MSHPITIEALQYGSWIATYPGVDPLEIRSLGLMAELVRGLDRLLAAIDRPMIPIIVKEQAETQTMEDDVDDVGFERDLDYLLVKNAELYRRLSQ